MNFAIPSAVIEIKLLLGTEQHFCSWFQALPQSRWEWHSSGLLHS